MQLEHTVEREELVKFRNAMAALANQTEKDLTERIASGKSTPRHPLFGLIDQQRQFVVIMDQHLADPPRSDGRVAISAPLVELFLSRVR